MNEHDAEQVLRGFGIDPDAMRAQLLESLEAAGLGSSNDELVVFTKPGVLAVLASIPLAGLRIIPAALAAVDHKRPVVRAFLTAALTSAAIKRFWTAHRFDESEGVEGKAEVARKLLERLADPRKVALIAGFSALIAALGHTRRHRWYTAWALGLLNGAATFGVNWLAAQRADEVEMAMRVLWTAEEARKAAKVGAAEPVAEDAPEGSYRMSQRVGHPRPGGMVPDPVLRKPESDPFDEDDS